MVLLVKLKSNIHHVGVGLRSRHFPDILSHFPPLAWFEILADNYINTHGILLEKLLWICEHYPVVLHSVALSIGSCDPLNKHYLRALKHLGELTHTQWYSDHVCWTSLKGQYCHELLPLPYTQEAIQHIVPRIKAIQDFLQKPFLIENISCYVNFASNEMPEEEFLATIAEKADCFILLDINNIYVNANNHQFNAEHYLRQFDSKRLKQIHLAGHITQQPFLIDTHGAPVSDPVWQLYQSCLALHGPIPTLIEWDNDIPSWPSMMAEVQKAQIILQNCEPA